jgi:RNA polymerase sigma-70 factor (ECF subfamily)
VASRLLNLTALWPELLGRRADLDDQALVRRVRKGDDEAFRVLFDRHAPPLWRFLSDLLGSEAAADEALQETVVRGFSRLEQLRHDERVLPWLFGIARHVALESLRAQRRDFPQDAHPVEEGDGDDAADPEAVLLGREAEAHLSRALESLSPDRRAALVMRVDHGLGYEDIAVAMGWSLAKVKNEIHRARLKLRGRLAQLRGEEA